MEEMNRFPVWSKLQLNTSATYHVEKRGKKPSEHSIVKAVLHHSFSWPQSSVGEKLPGANMVESELKWHLGTKRKKMCWILTVVSKTICGFCEDV